MPRKVQLVLVDPQNSFCKRVEPQLQQTLHDGELCIPGAWEDMERVAGLIRRLGGRLGTIDVTMDSHQLLHVANPIWFRDQSGRHPKPFTIMRAHEGVILGSRTDAEGRPQELGEFTTSRREFHERTVRYLEQLANENRWRVEQPRFVPFDIAPWEYTRQGKLKYLVHVINGRSVFEKDKVEGAQVVKIGKKKIWLNFLGRSMELQLVEDNTISID